jgi:hypothetical protein
MADMTDKVQARLGPVQQTLFMAARWVWSCDDPRSLESLGLDVVQAAAVTRPPAGFRTQLPWRYR